METYALFNNEFYKKRPWWMPLCLYGVVCQRANPRSREYMLRLLNAKFPQAILVEEENLPDITENLILLYPDSIGIGEGVREKKLLKKIKHINILNGRQRYFPLTKKTRSKLLFKRFLETTFIAELLIAPILVLISIAYAIKDKLTGRS